MLNLRYFVLKWLPTDCLLATEKEKEKIYMYTVEKSDSIFTGWSKLTSPLGSDGHQMSLSPMQCSDWEYITSTGLWGKSKLKEHCILKTRQRHKKQRKAVEILQIQKKAKRDDN